VEYIAHISNSGYGRAAKAYCLRLLDLGHELSILPIGPPQLENNVQDNRLSNCISKKTIPQLRIIHEIPHPQTAIGLMRNDGVPTVWFYAWELELLPQCYKDTLAQADYCVTFSQLQVDVYKKEMGKDNIYYLPHVIPSKPTVRKTQKNNDFTFLSVFRWDERKDPQGLLKSYLYGFNKEDNVRLVLKTSAIQYDAIVNSINMIMKHCRLRKNFPPVIPITKNLSQSELDSLYLEGDVFVSPTRAEGWGYGFNEALLYGLPCIYPDTNHINRTFFDSSNSLSVPTRKVFVYNHSFPETSDKMTWPQVDEIALAEQMRNAFVNYDKLFKLPVNIAQAYLDEQKLVDNYLNEILKLGRK